MTERGTETSAAPSGDPTAAGAGDPGATGTSTRQGQDWAVGTHLAGLSSLVGVPGVIGVLVVWLIKKDEYALVDEHGKEALNFQISLLIYAIIGAVLLLVLVGFLVLGIVFLLGLILPIVAAVKASNGETYRYPVTIRLID